MRTVFDNPMVAHVWAQQNQQKGHGSNFFFEGATIYSYGRHFPIARFVTNKKGQRAVLFNCNGYSISTGRHIGYTRHALPDDAIIFSVPDPASDDHKAIWQGYVKRIHEAAGMAKRARSNQSWRIRDVQALVEQANGYAAFFALRQRIDASGDVGALIATCAKEQAKINKKLEAEKRQRQREAQQREQEHLSQWLAGERAYVGTEKIYLRINQDKNRIETSRGAEFPIAHAKRAFPLIAQCRNNRTAWQRNGDTIPLGHFQIDRIDEQGNVTAGCHKVAWEEIEWIAMALSMEIHIANHQAETRISRSGRYAATEEAQPRRQPL